MSPPLPVSSCTSLCLSPSSNLFGYLRVGVCLSSFVLCVCVYVFPSLCPPVRFCFFLSVRLSPPPIPLQSPSIPPFPPSLLPTLLIQFQLFHPLSPARFSIRHASPTQIPRTVTHTHTYKLLHTHTHARTPDSNHPSAPSSSIKSLRLPHPRLQRSGHQGQGLDWE